MAAGAFKIFNSAKGALGSGNIDLAAGNFRLLLVQSGSLLSVGVDTSTRNSLSAAGFGLFAALGSYSASGKLLASVSWRLSGTKYLFDAGDWSLSQTAAMSKIKQCVIIESGGWPIAYTCLSATAFDLLAGNKLIVQFHASGIFTLD